MFKQEAHWFYLLFFCFPHRTRQRSRQQLDHTGLCLVSCTSFEIKIQQQHFSGQSEGLVGKKTCKVQESKGFLLITFSMKLYEIIKIPVRCWKKAGRFHSTLFNIWSPFFPFVFSRDLPFLRKLPWWLSAPVQSRHDTLQPTPVLCCQMLSKKVSFSACLKWAGTAPERKRNDSLQEKK